MATVDEEGIVTVLGRGSQCINTGGEKVYPEEVEQALKSHPDVYDALVAGVPDSQVGQPCGGRGAAARGRAHADPGRHPDALPHPAGRLQDPAAAGDRAGTIQRSPSGKADYRWARTVAAAADG